MEKEQFLEFIDVAIETGRGIKVEIKMPDLPSPEFITNPNENLEGKRAYYDKAYDDDLKLKTFDQIQIVGISLFK
ncbi:hypothetical protein ACQUEF_01715 [Vagococcus fluvialis]|uniref:hypothetical protein n=1 Tax=Vagococcus fluvialis TaxID=2738 RepID=UPI003D0E4C7B